MKKMQVNRLIADFSSGTLEVKGSGISFERRGEKVNEEFCIL